MTWERSIAIVLAVITVVVAGCLVMQKTERERKRMMIWQRSIARVVAVVTAVIGRCLEMERERER